ncbi:hypothetical protein BB561_000369 [Smittium simulii]|uniref:N-alpha-acetyltransferase 40 n=1 Tax=Smittium simulii TaxID=133385 RepID=A0A2T9YZD9_9FUNG|nr:hypothetical protein BB561_000369 [Smittium simulii]
MESEETAKQLEYWEKKLVGKYIQLETESKLLAESEQIIHESLLPKPYRVLGPCSICTMDLRMERLNVNTDDNHMVLYDKLNRWDDSERYAEIFDKDMRFVLIYDIRQTQKTTLVGFAGFNFSFEETASDFEVPVLYCYELQVRGEYRGAGIGQKLIRTLQEFMRKYQMTKLMLTCFTENARAVSFYRREGFESDEISPEWYDDSKEHGYIIMSMENSQQQSNSSDISPINPSDNNGDAQADNVLIQPENNINTSVLINESDSNQKQVIEQSIVVEEPVAVVEKLAVVVEKPVAVVEEPVAAVEEPTVVVEEPTVVVEEPAVVEEPVAVVEEPVAVVEEPVAVVEEPVAVVEEPVAVVEEPVAVVEEPVAVVEEPVAVVEEPVAVVEEPVAVVEEPVAVVEEPVAVVEEPVAVVEEPVAVVEEPESVMVAEPASSEEPIVLNKSAYSEEPVVVENFSTLRNAVDLLQENTDSQINKADDQNVPIMTTFIGESNIKTTDDNYNLHHIKQSPQDSIVPQKLNSPVKPSKEGSKPIIETSKKSLQNSKPTKKKSACVVM